MRSPADSRFSAPSLEAQHYANRLAFEAINFGSFPRLHRTVRDARREWTPGTAEGLKRAGGTGWMEVEADGPQMT